MSPSGATSWSKLADVPWSACQGGPARFGRVTDPWVSYDRAGNLYFIGQPTDSAALGISAISVTDRNGTSWRPPQILIEDRGDRFISNDKVSITGDPTRRDHAYATWLRLTHPAGRGNSPTADFHSFAFRGNPMISRTTNGGATWSTPVPMRQSNTYFQGNQIAVGPDGTLYNVTANLFTGAVATAQAVYMGVMRSPTPRHVVGAHQDLNDPHRSSSSSRTTASPIRAEDYLPDIAVDPTNGDIYVVWSDGLGTPIDKVVMAKSTDGGRHWSGPTVVATGGRLRAVLQPLDRGDRGRHRRLTYWDDRNNILGDGIATTDVWLRHSHDGAPRRGSPSSTFTGPFNQYTAPISFFEPGFRAASSSGTTWASRRLRTTTSSTSSHRLISDGADVHSIRANHP